MPLQNFDTFAIKNRLARVVRATCTLCVAIDINKSKNRGASMIRSEKSA